MALKDSWKKTGTEFGHAFKDLGKAFAHTAKDTNIKGREPFILYCSYFLYGFSRSNRW